MDQIHLFELLHCQCLALYLIRGNVAHQDLLFMGFPRQDYWSGQPFPSPGDLPDPGIEPVSPALQADCLPSEQPGKPQYYSIHVYKKSK